MNTSKEANSWIHLEDEDDELFLLNDSVHLNTSSLRSDERYSGFDNNVGDTWVYPSNFPERAYQYNIVQKALFHNTLVVLPTGLGKTFIAAVVMYNIYRWYPMGKVIFMAPTRPLVAQQIEACCKVVGIPSSDSVEITGKLTKANRAQLWHAKRVFFATPQSVLSDIQDSEFNFPFQSVKLVVVDEAHKAKGRYAYTDVLGGIWGKNKYFRVLALSATPGRRKEDVEEVIRNLFISNIEIRTEESVDVVSYVHKRHIKTVIVKLGPKLIEIRDKLCAIVDPHLRNLIDNRLITGRPSNISRNWLVLEQKKYREYVNNSGEPYKQELNTDFNICISMYHSIELLERHGVRVFLNNFEQSEDSTIKFVMIALPEMRQLIEKVRADVGPDPFAYTDQSMLNGDIAPIPKNIDFGHPKYEIARDHILAHFEANDKSRAIIFCEYRESVMLMHRLLLQHRPLIRSRVFVGQGGSGSIRAVTQKQQMRVMSDFRSGESNILIATSVAEEGIDVGEVDLIICFDINTTNPTRLVQRIGRTGRRSEGKVLLLATEGKEQAILKEVLLERNRINKYISRPNEFTSTFYKHSPRMVPTEFNPKCQKTFIQQIERQISPPKANSKVKKSKTKNKVISDAKSQHDLRHFFKQRTNLDSEEKMVFEEPVPSQDARRLEKCNNLSNKCTSPDQTNTTPKLNNVRNSTLKKYAKFVRSNPQSQTVSVKQSIASNRLSKDSLQFLVDFSPNFLLNLWLQMQDLSKKGIDEHNMPLKGMTADERHTVRAYSQIVNLVGSKENLANIVKSKQKSQQPLSSSSLNLKYDFIFGDLDPVVMCSGNTEYLLKKYRDLPHSPLSEQHSNNSFAQSTIYEEADDICDSFARNDESKDWIVHSKYMSQWEEQVCDTNDFSLPTISNVKVKALPTKLEDKNRTEPFTNQSTPLRSAPTEKLPLDFADTPIANEHPFKKHFTPNKIKTESTSNFFDDQFDDMIAANSCIIDCIENTTNSAPKLPHTNSPHESVLNSLTNMKLNNTSGEKPNTLAVNSLQDITFLEDGCEGYISDNKSKICQTSKRVNKSAPDNDNPGCSYSVNNKNIQKTEFVAQRASPDLFEDISDTVAKRDVKKMTPIKSFTNQPGDQHQTSPCLLTRNTLTWREIRSKYAKPSVSNNPLEKSELDESVEPPAPFQVRRRRRIILSGSDTSNDGTNCPEKSTVRKPDDCTVVNRGESTAKLKSRKKFRNSFISDEAALSGSASEDEMENTIGGYMMDSMVVHDDDVENDATKMMQVYLQSIRSPSRNRRGNFKIPQRRQFNDASKIFSQRIPEEESCYVDDSFVVCDEEPEIEQLTCPLEKAEEILRNRKRAKRKAKLANDFEPKLPKKRRILRICNSSDEE